MTLASSLLHPMKRRAFVAGVGTVLMVPHPGEAQQPDRTYRIGYIFPGTMPPSSPSSPVREAFRQTLSEIGFVVGRNVVEERRAADGRPERLAEIANELVRLNVQIIVTIGNAATLAARNATPVTPIVMVYVHDPESDGLIGSLARPGGNVTGIATVGNEFGAKMLQLTKELLPQASRLVVIMNRDNAPSRRLVRSHQQTAKPLGLMLVPMEVGDVEDFEKSFGAISALRPDAIWFVSTVFGRADYPRIVQLALRHRLPCIMGSRGAVQVGALMSYGEDDLILWRRVARYVGSILQGAKASELPVEQPTKLELAINLKTAKALNLTIPPSLLLRADQVIE